MDEQALELRSENRPVPLVDLETYFAHAALQRELLEGYIKDRLKPHKHFYVLGGDNRKPSLTKEGAELVCLPHGLKPRYEIISGPDQPPMEDNPYQITVRCELQRGTHFEGQGLGSASSHVTKRDGERGVRQIDPGLRHNATLKMASKSAYIAATLNATAASEFFTQDMEDDHTLGRNTTPHPPTTPDTGHWCEQHQTNYFKTSKMRGYAHKVEGTDKWCNEPHKAPEDKVPDVGRATEDMEALWEQLGGVEVRKPEHAFPADQRPRMPQAEEDAPEPHEDASGANTGDAPGDEMLREAIGERLPEKYANAKTRETWLWQFNRAKAIDGIPRERLEEALDMLRQS